MSKGLGENYVLRMKRWHVPRLRNPRARIELIVDRAFYHDGMFKYKLPRYYKDRLYRMKFPYVQNVWNKKKNCYEQKEVYRYASKNPLALQMQAEIRNRVLAQYHRRFAELRATFPDKSDLEIDIEIVRSEVVSRISRQQDCYSKMSRFYNRNRFKNRKF